MPPPSRLVYIHSNPHGVKKWNTNTDILTAIRNSNLTCISLPKQLSSVHSIQFHDTQHRSYTVFV